MKPLNDLIIHDKLTKNLSINESSTLNLRIYMTHLIRRRRVVTILRLLLQSTYTTFIPFCNNPPTLHKLNIDIQKNGETEAVFRGYLKRFF